MNNMDKKIKPEKKFVRIRYEDETGAIQEAVIQLHDYIEGDSYRENMDRAMSDLYEGGGFWLNSDTIIPYHQVKSLHSHKLTPTPPTKPKQKSQRRMRPRRTKTTTTPKGNEDASQ